MLKETNVIKVDVADPAKVYDTPGAAIQGVIEDKNAKATVDASAEISGAMIESAEWSDTSAVFRLSTGHSVTIGSNSNEVEWQIHQQGHTHLLPVDTSPRRLQLQFPHESESWTWERAEKLENRVGQRFVTLLQTDFGLFFYAENCKVLLFNSISVIEDDSILLFWDNAE